MQNEYQRIALAARRNVSKLTLKQQKKVHSIYESAINNLINDIYKHDEKSLASRWKNDYVKQLDKVSRNLYREIRESTKDGIRKGAKFGADSNKDILKNIFDVAGIDPGDHFTTAFSQVQEGVIKDIIAGDIYSDGKTLSERIWNTKSEFEKDIQYVISQGIAEKKSTIELAEDLEQFVKDKAQRKSTWRKSYPHLKNKTIDYNAQRLARTSINHAYQSASVKSSNMNPFIEGIEWRSALIHGRTCELCRERHGQVFDKDSVPLDHPNGLCTMLPSISKSTDEVATELRDWVDGGENKVLDEWYEEYGDYFAGVKKPNDDIIKEGIKKASEASKDAKKTYKSTKEAFNKVSYRGIDKEFAEKIDKRFLDLANTYPINTEEITIKALKNKRNFGSYSNQVYNKGKRKLGYRNQIVVSSYNNRDEAYAKAAHIAEAKYRASKNMATLSTIDHEYAHAIDMMAVMKKNPELKPEALKWVGKKLRNEDVDAINDINRRINESPEKFSERLFVSLGKEFELSDAKLWRRIYSELGDYATENKNEFFAEGFSAYRHIPKEEQTEFVKKFGEHFEKLFEEVFR